MLVKHFEISRLDGRFDWGVIVEGLNVSELVDATLRSELYDLWIREGLVVFRGSWSASDHLAVSRVFGELREHPVAEAMPAGARELTDIRHDPNDGWIMRLRGEERAAIFPWHSDLIYVDKINHGGILRPVILPSKFGQTGFIDKISAYRDLSPDLKERIEDLHVAYQYDLDISKIRFGPDQGGEIIRYSSIVSGIQDRAHTYPTAIHPMVYEQPETGRKVLNVSPWFALGIYEMPNAEGDDLFEAIVQHAAASSRAYYHNWRMDEMVLWDNWRMLHSASGAPLDEVRYLQRTTIGGDYGLGKVGPGPVPVGETIKFLHV